MPSRSVTSAAIARGDLGGDALGLAQLARHHQHPAARQAESRGDAAADAFAASSNDDAAVFERDEHGRTLL
jgi:hypothetical protein